MINMELQSMSMYNFMIIDTGNTLHEVGITLFYYLT